MSNSFESTRLVDSTSITENNPGLSLGERLQKDRLTRFESMFDNTSPNCLLFFDVDIQLLLDVNKRYIVNMGAREMYSVVKLTKRGLLIREGAWCWLSEEGKQVREKIIQSARSLMESEPPEQEV